MNLFRPVVNLFRHKPRTAARIEYVRERADWTIPHARIANASDLQLVALYAVQGEYRPVIRGRQHARKENLRRIYDELTRRGAQATYGFVGGTTDLERGVCRGDDLR